MAKSDARHPLPRLFLPTDAFAPPTLRLSFPSRSLMMPTRTSFFSLVAAGLVVAAQGPLTSSLVGGPTNLTPTTTRFTTIRTTVIVTLTSFSPPTTIPFPPVATTTTFVVSSPPPLTITTTIYSDSSSSSSYDPNETPMESRTPSPFPTKIPNSSIIHNPGALAGLIVGVCVLVAGLAFFAWFTLRNHRLKELELRALDPPIGGPRHSVSARDWPPGSGHSRVIDGHPDLEVQSSIGPEMRPSSIAHDIGPSISGFLGARESPEQVDYEVGYPAKDPAAASSNGHSSHGHATVITRTSSLTHVTTRNASPTLPRQNPNRARFSISPDRVPVPSAWQTSRSEAPTRRGSVDEGSTLSYHPHRVNSDPVVFADVPPLMSVYPRRQSSEAHRSEMFQPSILVHPIPSNPPSSLLRPPSATQIPTLSTLQRPQPSAVYLNLPFVSEPCPSPAASEASILPMREGLLETPPNHPADSAPSLSDGRDYSRQLAGGVVSGTRDSTSMADPESDSEAHPNRDRGGPQPRSPLR